MEPPIRISIPASMMETWIGPPMKAILKLANHPRMTLAQVKVVVDTKKEIGVSTFIQLDVIH